MPGIGPPLNPNRRRRNVGPPATELPAEGRVGDPPDWPLTRASAREKAAWLRYWAKPQAVMWERIRCEDIVARYIRLKIRAEDIDAPPQLSAEVRQLEDDLGLSPSAMRSMQWRVNDDELPEERAPVVSSAAIRRLRAVDSDAVAGA